MEKLELFLKWLENFDISYDGIELRKCDFGYGIFAKRDFHINETILSIPLQLLITPSSVVQLSNIKLKPFEILVLFFILEEIESSLWSPYLQILPITFTTLAAAGAELDISYLPLNARTLWEKQSNEMKMMFNKTLQAKQPLSTRKYCIDVGGPSSSGDEILQRLSCLKKLDPLLLTEWKSVRKSKTMAYARFKGKFCNTSVINVHAPTFSEDSMQNFNC
ncbi:unnamed protein product [Dracunculus medinensis]|uniref:FBD domain-containing protein n=1 Tax=Dracunculus medinensis TaxID=318479 RepID=A0A0N4UM71_DRAME|nr:unnamed protein product [Dracunculus medinensis]